jgi:hypothetical protein
MSDLRNLCRGVALAWIVAATPALADTGTADTAGVSPEGYVASELMQTSQSDLGVRTSVAMEKVARGAPDAANASAQALGAAFEKELAWDGTHGTLAAGDHVPTTHAALAMLAMAADKDKLGHEADFLLAHQDPDGSIAEGFTFKGHKVVADNDARTLLTQAAAIRGWLAAWGATHDDRYRAAARRAYLYAQRSLWSASAGVYKASEHAKQTTYDGLLLGTMVGALRDLAAAHDGAVRAEFAQRLDSLWQAVARQGNPLAGVTFATRH